jgi:UDP-N-acetylglucosamine 2-epimerase
MIKVVTIVGTRPEIIRLSRVLPALDKYYDHTLVHTGQNYDYELNEVFFTDLSLRKPDYFLNCGGGAAAEVIANVIVKTDQLLRKIAPDAVLILGDTNSALASISAKRLKIPIFHMEAGNRSFDLRVPEEINRKIVDHIADVNLTYSAIARDYLLREGISPDFVINTGSPMKEVLSYYSEKIVSSEIVQKMDLTPRKYFVVSLHREENVDVPEKLHELGKIFDFLVNNYAYPIVFSVHPRTRLRLEELGMKFNEYVKVLKPLSFTDYVALQLGSFVVMSDSGTITEEASILNLRALNLRDSQERPEGFEEGTVMLTGVNLSRITQALKILNDQHVGELRTIHPVMDYMSDTVSEKVCRIILSYLDYVNTNVWKKNINFN